MKMHTFNFSPDDLFVPSALPPPETNTHSSYQVKLQKEVKSTQKQPSCNAAHAKKDSMKKIQGGGPEVAVMVG